MRSPLHVFVVEDHEDVQSMLTMLLETWGHRVSVATTVEEALREIPSSGLDVLISDIGLPDGTGWDLLRQLNLPAHVCPIAFTGRAGSDDLNRSQGAGFRHHLLKTADFSVLQGILDALPAHGGHAHR